MNPEGRRKVLVFTDWYLPGYRAGGPIQSIANLAEHLGKEFEFRIVTSDEDLNADAPYHGIQSDVWIAQQNHSSVYYISKPNRNFQTIRKLIFDERADVIYLNSVFSKVFTIFPLMVRQKSFPTRKLVLAPRGMLGKGALDIKSGKKKGFLLMARITGLYKNIRWQASSAEEMKEIKKVFGAKAMVTEALNLTAPRSLNFVHRTKKIAELKVVFLSRISSKKNLEAALMALKRIPGGCRVEFDIYGPVEDAEYWKSCELMMRELPGHVHARYAGVIANDAVYAMLQHYHLSILLTRHENFGHSIVESMAAGCMVLISDQTPWRNLAEKGLGWDIAPEQTDAIDAALLKAIRMNQEEFDRGSRAALTFAEGIIQNPGALEQNRSLFAT